MDRCGCGSVSYGSTGTLDAQERDLAVALRGALRAGDTTAAARIESDLAGVRDRLAARRWTAARAVSLPSARVRASSSVSPDRLPSVLFHLPSESDLAAIPETRVLEGDLRLDTRHRVFRSSPVTKAEIDAFSWGTAPSLGDSVRLVEDSVVKAFRRENARQYPGIAKIRAAKFEDLLHRLRIVATSVGQESGVGRLDGDLRVAQLERELRQILVSASLPEWYVTLTGRLLPLYARQGAEGSRSGYLRPGYGS